ncbi:hypothetical protein D3C73_1013740 [compost metagenome]
MVRRHGQVAQGRGNGATMVARRFGHQPRFIEQFVTLQHALLGPAGAGGEGEQRLDAAAPGGVVSGPGGQGGAEALHDGRTAPAPVLPGEDVEDRRPGGVAARRVEAGGAEAGVVVRIGGQGQVADRNLARLVGAGGGARRVAAQVAEGVELLDEAQGKAGLGRHEGAQGQFEGAVARGVERAEGQGRRAVGGMGGQDGGLAVPQGDDHRRQADPDAGLRGCRPRPPLRHASPLRQPLYSVCQASAPGRMPTASARTR